MFWIFMLCLWFDQSEFFVLFVVFDMYVGPGFIFELHS